MPLKDGREVLREIRQHPELRRLPLVVFTVFFALAVARIAPQRRKTVVEFFDGIADALLIVIGWVLWIAPLGVFALGFALGASAGGAAEARADSRVAASATALTMVPPRVRRLRRRSRARERRWRTVVSSMPRVAASWAVERPSR